jgi:hypothetical protein
MDLQQSLSDTVLKEYRRIQFLSLRILVYPHIKVKSKEDHAK